MFLFFTVTEGFVGINVLSLFETIINVLKKYWFIIIFPFVYCAFVLFYMYLLNINFHWHIIYAKINKHFFIGGKFFWPLLLLVSFHGYY